MEIKNNMLKCNYAWGHLDFKKGKYAPCFRFDVNLSPVPDNREMLPSSVLNSNEFKEIRKELQQGFFPKGCADCKYKEENGLTSYRQESLFSSKFSNKDIDYNSLEINRLYELELKFSRKCNFLCRHCDSNSNDSFEVLGKKNQDIELELKNLGFNHISKGKSPIPKMSFSIIDDIINNLIPITDRVFFSGGEPLFHDNHYKFLIELINNQNVDTKKLNLGYNTNLSLIRFKNYNVFDLWKNFKSIDLTISLDGTGMFFNYFRERGDYDTVVNNLNEIVNKSENINSILLVCTCSAYHAFYAEEIFTDITNLIKELEQKNKNIKIYTKPTFVHYPKHLDMVNLDDNTKKILIDRLYHSLNKTSNVLYNESITQIIKKLEGVRTETTEKFKEIAKIQDRLYNKNSKDYCSKIYKYVYNNKII